MLICFSDVAGFYLHSFRRHQQSLTLPVICQSETFNISLTDARRKCRAAVYGNDYSSPSPGQTISGLTE
jgi:hypothetical protein